ncbi:ACR3 family arsenite transporter [Paraburkholderia sp. GAS41]|uniref:ACR3 family arsenite efflux transporter n=1 Tax=Paraburkholderia sp. GAS41 TaxID=3035134 RepID=UPI003D1B358E
MSDPSQFEIDRTYTGRWTVTFSNPPINMFVPATIVEMGSLMADLEADLSVKVVVFQSANPDFFIAHLDVARAAEQPEVLGLWRDVVLRLSSTPVVSIAKVRGRARGIGNEFLLACAQVKSQWRGIGVTLFVNWFVKPCSMALLGWIFIRHVFAPWLPADQLDSYIAGLILLAAAPCTAMVFVWSQLCKGDPYFTLSQVALNDSIMIVAFAPLVALLLGLSVITVPWDTLIASVGLYIVVPVIMAQLVRKRLLAKGEAYFQRAVAQLGPYSICALLATLVLLFAFQGQAIVREPLVIAMLAVPILIQVFFNSGLAYMLNRKLGVAHCVAGPSSLIGASNFFELAVATAISLFGFRSGAALATVVGVLIEVPVMLLVVSVVNRSQHWYEAGDSRKEQKS